jgi:hypothetical protein
MPRDQFHVWYHTDDGFLPDAVVNRRPWELVGTSGVIDRKGLRITTVASAGFYRRRTTPRDPPIARSRPEDRIEVAMEFTGATQAPVWASGVSAHVMFIDDGERAIGLSIGPDLTLIDPSTGDVIKTIQTGWGWLHKQSYRLLKHEGEAFEVFVGGRPLIRWPYEAAAVSSNTVASFGWGWLDAGGSGEAVWESVDGGLNMVLPPQWKVDRERVNMPIVLQELWGIRHRALLRAFLGTSQNDQDAMNHLFDRFTAARIVVEDADFSGERLATLEDPPWVVTGDPGLFGVTRERVRIGKSAALAAYIFSFATPGNLTEFSIYARATFTVREFGTRDPTSRVGPFIRILNGDKRISAVMVYDRANPQSVGWVLSDGTLGAGAGLGNVGEVVWGVEPTEPHTVELHIIARNRVVMLIDGLLVEDQPYSRFTATTAFFSTTIGRDGGADLRCTVDMDSALTELSYSANRRRDLFLQRLAERLIFVGGCERNDHLDVWNRNRHGVHQMRGTETGLRNEVRRISCDDDASIEALNFPAEWFLEVTFPDITPIFLEAEGTIGNLFIEYRNKAPNFSPDDLETLLRKYLLPRSVVEVSFFLALATELTSATVTGGTTTFTVENPLGFVDGDLITLREKISGGTVLDLDYVDKALPRASDTMLVSSFLGAIWANWTFEESGLNGTEIGGQVSLPGLDSDKVNNITAGEAVEAFGASAGVSGFVDIFGIENGTGNAVRERLLVSGVSVTTGTVLWDEVHGVTFSVNAQDDVTVRDEFDLDTLYVISSGTRASGAYLFDPGFIASPAVVDAESDGATTESIILHGGESLGGTITVELAMSGVSTVSTSETWAEVQVITAGFIPAAQTITARAVFCDTAGVVTMVSDSTSDLMRVRVYGVDSNGDGQFETIALSGLSPVSGTLNYARILGIELAETGVGTITVTITGGSRTIAVGSFDSSVSFGLGVGRRRIDTVGNIQVNQAQPQLVSRPVIVFGLDEDGAFQIETLYMQATAFVQGVKGWSNILGIAMGNIDPTRDVTVYGVAFRSESVRVLVVDLADTPSWTASIPVSALDVVLDQVANLDAKAGALALTGDFSVLEDTSITTIDQDTGDVETPAIAGSFGIGAIMRRRT